MRFEVPALIVVEADNADDAMEKARALGPNIEGINEERDPELFPALTVAVIDFPRESEDRDDETISTHAEGLQMAAGFPW